MTNKDRIEEIRKYAKSLNEKEKLHFEIHARPMVWELLSELDKGESLLNELGES